MGLTEAQKAGVALFVGVVQFGLFEMVAEFVYPGYSVSANRISDLGPPCGSVGCPTQVSWYVFDASIAMLGVLALVSAYFIHHHFRWRPFSGLILLVGLGALGVGVFNESAPYDLHGLFSLVTFLAIGLAAILSYRLQRKPLGYFSTILGLVSLVSLVIYIPDAGVSAGASLGIGPGGLERLIVYPVLFWSLAFAGHLMALSEPRA